LGLLCAVVAVCIALLADLPSLLTPRQKLFAVIEQPYFNFLISEYHISENNANNYLLPSFPNPRLFEKISAIIYP
jgi:hypothetical protein